MVQPVQEVGQVGASRNLNAWEKVDVPDANPILSAVVNVGHSVQVRGVVSVEVSTKVGVNGTLLIEVGFAQKDGSIVFEVFTVAAVITGGTLFTNNITRKVDYIRLTFTATLGTPATAALSGYVRS